MDPMQRQAAMSKMANQPPVSSAPQGIFGPEEKREGPDSEEGLMRELQDLEKMKMDGSMSEPDYLKNLQSLQSRWEAISPKPYMSQETPSIGPFGR